MNETPEPSPNIQNATRGALFSTATKLLGQFPERKRFRIDESKKIMGIEIELIPVNELDGRRVILEIRDSQVEVDPHAHYLTNERHSFIRLFVTNEFAER